jgi:hypothetical protein
MLTLCQSYSSQMISQAMPAALPSYPPSTLNHPSPFVNFEGSSEEVKWLFSKLYEIPVADGFSFRKNRICLFSPKNPRSCGARSAASEACRQGKREGRPEQERTELPTYTQLFAVNKPVCESVWPPVECRSVRLRSLASVPPKTR